MKLTEEQESFITENFHKFPDLIRLSSLTFKSNSLDPRSEEVRVVRLFVTEKSFMPENLLVEPIQLELGLKEFNELPSKRESLSPQGIINNNGPRLYQPQKLAAEEIAKVWYLLKSKDGQIGNQWAIFNGACRAGKMDAIHHAAGRFFEESSIRRPEARKLLIYIFCGSSIAAKNDAKNTFVEYTSNMENCPIIQLDYFLKNGSHESLVNALGEYNCTHNSLILHQPDLKYHRKKINHLLKTLKEAGADILVVLDECDSYTNRNGLVDEFLAENGVYLSTLTTDYEHFKILPVSATCPAYLEKAQSEEEYNNRWERVNPMVVTLQLEEGYVDLEAMLEADRILEIEDLFLRDPEGNPFTFSPWFIKRLKDMPLNKWNIVRYYGDAERNVLEAELKRLGIKLHLIASREDTNTEDMMELMKCIPLENSAVRHIFGVIHSYGRGVELQRDLLGHVFEPRVSDNESLDWQRLMRQNGYYDLQSTAFKLFCSLDRVSKIIKSNSSIESWANRITTDKPELLRSNHYKRNVVKRLAYESLYVLRPEGCSIKQYIKDENLKLDYACNQQTEDKNLYQSAIDFNGRNYGVKRSGEEDRAGVAIVILDPPNPKRAVPDSHKDSYKKVVVALCDPDDPRSMQAQEQIGCSHAELVEYVCQCRILHRINPLAKDDSQPVYREGSGIEETSALWNPNDTID